MKRTIYHTLLLTLVFALTTAFTGDKVAKTTYVQVKSIKVSKEVYAKAQKSRKLQRSIIFKAGYLYPSRSFKIYKSGDVYVVLRDAKNQLPAKITGYVVKGKVEWTGISIVTVVCKCSYGGGGCMTKLNSQTLMTECSGGGCQDCGFAIDIWNPWDDIPIVQGPF